MIKLLVESTRPENPTIFVRWCLSKRTAERLIGDEFAKVIICVVYDNGKEERFLRNLSDGVMPLTFRFPGTHKVLASVAVVKKEERDDYEPEKFFKNLTEKYSQFDYYLKLVSNGSIRFTEGHIERQFQPVEAGPDAVTEITVDSRHFAKERPKWITELINNRFEGKTRDDCHFRKRAVLALPALMLVAATSLLIGVFRTIKFVCLASLCARGLNFKAIWQHELDVADEVWISGSKPRPSYWCVEDTQGNNKSYRLLVSPLFGILLATTHFLLVSYTGVGLERIWYFIVREFKSIYTLVLWAAVLVVLGIGGLYTFTKLEPKIKERQWKNVELAKIRRKAELEESVRFLACSTERNKSAFAYKSLPKNHQTLELRWHNLKRRVCRPFAG